MEHEQHPLLYRLRPASALWLDFGLSFQPIGVVGPWFQFLCCYVPVNSCVSPQPRPGGRTLVPVVLHLARHLTQRVLALRVHHLLPHGQTQAAEHLPRQHHVSGQATKVPRPAANGQVLKLTPFCAVTGNMRNVLGRQFVFCWLLFLLGEGVR